MTKSIFALMLVASLFVLFSGKPINARSRYRHPTPTPTITPTPTVTPTGIQPTPTPTSGQPGNGFCINYGHQATIYSQSTVNVDLGRLGNSNIKCLRLAYNGWNNPPSEQLAIWAKAAGFRVIIGGDWGVLTSTQLSTYRSSVLQEAVFAQNNQIDQFSLGNEQEYRLSGLTNTQWMAFLTSLATDVKAIYSGKVSYETSSDFVSNWVTNGLGSIDLIGFNSYCGYGCNSNRLTTAINAFGKSRVYVSETNADMDTGLYNSDSSHATEVTNDAKKLLSFGVPIYYFTYSTCNANGVNNNWGLFQCGAFSQPLTAAVLGIK